jgi:hypothetical protein
LIFFFESRVPAKNKSAEEAQRSMSRAVRLVELGRLGQGDFASLRPETCCAPRRSVLSGRFLALVEDLGTGGSEPIHRRNLSLSSSAPLSDLPEAAKTAEKGEKGEKTPPPVKKGKKTTPGKKEKRAHTPKKEKMALGGESKSPRKAGSHRRSHSTTSSSSSGVHRKSKSDVNVAVPDREGAAAETDTAGTAARSSCFSVIGLEFGPDGQPAPLVLRKPAQCDAVLAHPTKPIVAVRRASSPPNLSFTPCLPSMLLVCGSLTTSPPPLPPLALSPPTVGNIIQVFDVVAKNRIGTVTFLSNISFWSWIRDGTALGVVDDRAVHVWPNLTGGGGDGNGSSGPGQVETVFGRPERFRGEAWQVTSLTTDTGGNWTLVGGLRHDKHHNRAVGMLVLYNNKRGAAQCIEGFAAAFGSQVNVQESDRGELREIMVFAGQGKITCASIDEGKRLNITADLPLTASDEGDFAVGIEIDSDLGLVFVLTKLGRCVLFALSVASDGSNAAAHMLYNERVSAEAVFTTSGYGQSEVRPAGICALNRGGQILYLTADVHGLLDSVRDDAEVQLVLQRRLTRHMSSRPQLTLPRASSSSNSSSAAAEDSSGRPPMRRMQSEPAVSRTKTVEKKNEEPSSSSATTPDTNPFQPTRELPRGDSPEKEAAQPVLNPFGGNSLSLSAPVSQESADAKDVLDSMFAEPSSSSSSSSATAGEADTALEPGFASSSSSSSPPPAPISADSNVADDATLTQQIPVSTVMPAFPAPSPPKEEEEPSVSSEDALDLWLDHIENEDFAEAAKLALHPAYADVLRVSEVLAGSQAPSIGYYAALMQALQSSPGLSTASQQLTPAEAVALITPTMFLGKQGVAQIKTWWHDGFVPACREVGDVVSRHDRHLGAEILGKIAGDADAQGRALELLTSDVRKRKRGHVRTASAGLDSARILDLLRDGDNLSAAEVLSSLEALLSRLPADDDGDDGGSAWAEETEADFVNAAAVVLTRGTINVADLTRVLALWWGKLADDFPTGAVRLLRRCITQAISGALSDTSDTSDTTAGRARAVALSLSAVKIFAGDQTALDFALAVVSEHGSEDALVGAAGELISAGHVTHACAWLCAPEKKTASSLSDSGIPERRRHKLSEAVSASPVAASWALFSLFQGDESERTAIVTNIVLDAVRGSRDRLLSVLSALVAVSPSGPFSFAPDAPEADLLKALASALLREAWEPPTSVHSLAAALHASPRPLFEHMMSRLGDGDRLDEWLPQFLKLGYHLGKRSDETVVARFCAALLSGETPLMPRLPFDRPLASHSASASVAKHCSEWLSAFAFAWANGWCKEAARAAEAFAQSASLPDKARLQRFVTLNSVCRTDADAVERIVELCGGEDECVEFCVRTHRWPSLAARVASCGDPSDQLTQAVKFARVMVDLQVPEVCFAEFKSSCGHRSVPVSGRAWTEALQPEPAELPSTTGAALSVAQYLTACRTVEAQLADGQVGPALDITRQFSLFGRFSNFVLAANSASLDAMVAKELAAGDESVSQRFASVFASPASSAATELTSPMAVRMLKILVDAGHSGGVVALLRSLASNARALFVNAALAPPASIGRNPDLQNTLLLTALSDEDFEKGDLEDLADLCDAADAAEVGRHFVEAGHAEIAAGLYERAGLHREAVDVLADADDMSKAFALAQRSGSLDAWQRALERHEEEQA